ncbi:AB-hydrolase YheT [Polyporus arcularius HHB13444]|uniref:AB-hydrolase YheT n=1 Tax=Polyporus arcularius HHB13444 TaxID=1314778 RepID=A0A5C3PDA2_9APHY|nr:AB-hydrolase YheT [Polyporus arcularius HHB13444]
MTFRDDVRVLITAGVLSLLSAIRAVWGHLSGARRPFVTLYMSPDSAILGREGGGPESTLADLVVTKVPALWPSSKFNSPWWLPSGDAHTIYSSIADFSTVDPIVYERKFLELPDRGIVAVDITPPLHSHPIAEGENVLFVAHGLTGGSHEAYVRAVLSRVTPDRPSGGLGFRAVVLNFRGCNGSPVVTPRLYHAGSSDDVRNVILWIYHTFPECRIYGCGFSLGANILTKYAGEEGEDCPLQGLVTLANPWNFVSGAGFLPSTILGRFVYRYVLGGALRALLHLHRRVFLEAAELPLSRARLEDVLSRRRRITLMQYDELITAPLYGFAGAMDYYAKISSSKVIPDIRIPCLAINSADDPVTGADSLPTDQVARSPYLVLAVTQGGGHLGWYERTADGRLRRWYVKPVEQFLAALAEYGGQQRRKPGIVLYGADFARQDGRDDVGFRVLSRAQSELVASGTETSKLFTGW